MGKNPASQFYWGDWRRDPGLHACSFQTRGIWMEMLSIMHECDPRGYFTFNGGPPSEEEGVKVIGCSVKEYQGAVAELEHCHVLSRDSHGIIFNRRMVRDERERLLWRERQKRHREGSHADVTQMSRKCHSYLHSSSSNNKEYVEDSTELRLASLLLEEILKNKPDLKRPNLQTWAKEVDLIIRIDGRNPDRIREVIVWAQGDSFWRKNILSTGSLRKSFDRLEMAMGTKNGKSW